MTKGKSNKTRIMVNGKRPKKAHSNVKGCMRVEFAEGGKILTTKSYTVNHKRPFNQAYAMACKYAKALALEKNISQDKIEYMSREECKSRADVYPHQIDWESFKKGDVKSDVASVATSANPKTCANAGTLIDVFSTIPKFRAAIKNVYKQIGYERAKEILSVGMETLEEVSAIDREKAQKSADAAVMMAQSLFDTYKQTGIDLSENISNENILRLFKNHIRKDNEKTKPKPKTTSSNPVYQLGDERWQGKGHVPRSFIVWRKENNKSDFEELRIN